MAALCGFGSVMKAVTGPRELSGRVGRCQTPGCFTARARWQPLRGLPSSALVKPVVQQQKPACRRGHPQDERDHEDRHRKGRPVRRQHRYRQHADACGGRAGHRRDCLLVHRFPGGLRRPGSGQPGGDVAGEGGEVRVGPRRQSPADPQVELVPVQPSLHEGGLEHLDHLLAVGVGRPQAAMAARARRYLVSRPCHLRHPLHEHDAPSVARLIFNPISSDLRIRRDLRPHQLPAHSPIDLLKWCALVRSRLQR